VSKSDRPAGGAAGTDAPDIPLPGAAAKAARDYPDLWAAVQRVGEEAGQAGPLDGRSKRLAHLAFAMASGSEGATHSHARRALAEGFAPEELEHVAILGVTTLGWPQALRSLTWVRDVTAGGGGRKTRAGAE
jgi:alkylhydroperoxidase/carboxymuconolactone decarboxylase family protein YurZ